MNKSTKVDLPPKPKGPAAINLDSSYANPKGPLTLRANKGSDGRAAVPSCGGTGRAGKDSSDCDDSLSNPGRFDRTPPKIGRASCRGRGEISVGAGSLKKKKKRG